MLSQAMIAVYGYAARETAEVLLRAKDLIDDVTDPAQKLAILYGIWAGHYVGGEVAKQTDAAGEFLKEAERNNDMAALSVAHRIMGTTYATKGEFAAALPHLEQARALYDPQHGAPLQYQYGQDVGAAALCYLSWALWHLGSVDQASQVAADAVKRARGAVPSAHPGLHHLPCPRHDRHFPAKLGGHEILRGLGRLTLPGTRSVTLDGLRPHSRGMGNRK